MENTRQIKINDEYTLVIPKGYRKKKLKNFKIWVEALESGRYKQGRYSLCEVSKTSKGKKSCNYCCLGVLVQKAYNFTGLSSDGVKCIDYKEDSIAISIETYLPDKIVEEEGLESGLGGFPTGVFLTHGTYEYIDLGECNDLAKLNFKEIAKIIRSIWK